MLEPLSNSQWTEQTARHLIARAGFDAPPQFVQKLHAMGLDQAVNSLVQFQERSRTVPQCAEPHSKERIEIFKKAKAASPEEREKMQKEVRRQMILELQEFQGWWLKQMVETTNPLQEKLALFWHGHFATSFDKVKAPHLLWTQNELFRNQGIGKFGDLLVAVSLDPAMLLYLDGNENRASHPNENFAREVMELFCLGEGHYSEKDVQEAARAFTGWKTRRLLGKAEFSKQDFDSGSKTILGKTTPFDAAQALQHIAAQPSCAEWICGKLWNYFASTPNPEAIASLSALFQKTEGDLKAVLLSLFKSEAFYSSKVLGQQIKSPIQWLIASIRLLERELPPPLVCVNLLTQLGQTPLRPPNVKGWDGGIAWVTTSNLLNRYNFAALLVEGVNIFKPQADKPMNEMTDDSALGRQSKLDKISNRLAQNLSPVSIDALFTAEERKNPKFLLEALQKRFLFSPLKNKDQVTLDSYLSSQKELTPTTILHTIRLLMSTTQYQLT